MKVSIRLALILFLGALGSCANTFGRAPQDEGALALAARGLPPVASLDSYRGTSSLVDHVVLGKDALTRSANTLPSGDALLLNSQAAPAFEWAVYSVATGQPLSFLKVHKAAPAGGMYIGLANYDTGRWQFSGPYSGSGEVSVQLFAADYHSPGGNFYCVLLSSGGQLQVDSVNVVTNEDLPLITARLELLPAELQRGAELTLDGSTSSTLSGEIVNYEWDRDGDGDFEIGTGATSSTTTTPQFAGTFTLALRVTNSLGQKSVGTAELTVHGFNTPVSPDSDDIGRWPSLALVNGRPAIAYYEAGGEKLRYVRAQDKQGSVWGTPQLISGLRLDTETAGRIQLLVVNGSPAIAFHNDLSHDLRYVQASNADGTAWKNPLVLDNSGNVGEYCSMQIVNGKPAVSYYDNSAGNLSFVRASDVDGTVWGEPQDIVTSGNVGLYTSMEIADGQPAICYQDLSSRSICYVRALDADGASWGQPLTLDAPVGPQGNIGLYISTALINGFPAVTYHNDFVDIDGDDNHGVLHFIRAKDEQGSAWGTIQILDNGTDTGEDSSLQLINGHPTISYFEQTAFDLRFVQAEDTEGDSWPEPKIIDGVGDTGETTCMAGVDGGYGIAYRNIGNNDLSYIWGY